MVPRHFLASTAVPRLFRRSSRVRFQKVPQVPVQFPCSVQFPGQVPEGSGGQCPFWCSSQVTFGAVPRSCYGRFRCSSPIRFRKVVAQRKVSACVQLQPNNDQNG